VFVLSRFHGEQALEFLHRVGRDVRLNILHEFLVGWIFERWPKSVRVDLTVDWDDGLVNLLS
jgi:hypothetical protein